jgi:hypothetical protein
MNHTVTWRCVLSACELIHIFICTEEKNSNYAENISGSRTKFSHSYGRTPLVFARLQYSHTQKDPSLHESDIPSSFVMFANITLRVTGLLAYSSPHCKTSFGTSR